MKLKGQGVVEGVVAVGILGMLMTGVVVLLIMSLGNKRVQFDRKKAMELGSMVIEEQVSRERNDDTFWNLTIKPTPSPRSGFDNYQYSIGFTNITNSPVTYPGCGVGKTNCAEMVVRVDWTGKTPQTLYFNRFFSR